MKTLIEKLNRNHYKNYEIMLKKNERKRLGKNA
jgi:hypothetical protein